MKLANIILFLSISIGIQAQIQWQEKLNKDGIVVWLKDHDASAHKKFKAETTFPYPIEVVTAALLDINRVPSYYHLIEQVSSLHQMGKLKAQYVLHWDFPWPTDDRYCLVESEMSSTASGHIQVTTKSIGGDNHVQGKIQVESIESSWELIAQNNGTTKAIHAGFMDPGGMLPGWLAKVAIVDSPYLSLIEFKKLLSEYQDRPFTIEEE